MTLFEHQRQVLIDREAPLAARMRPRSLDEFVGQDAIVGPGRLLRRAIQADQLSSLIFYGPPGTGKTTLARIIANTTRGHFIAINAVLAGVKDIREAIATAQARRGQFGQRTILFIDEVHRFNKAQQDALLPWVENGTVILIGATTENPYFEVNKALVSRSRIFQLRSLDDDDLRQIAHQTLTDAERGYGDRAVTLTTDALDHLVRVANGDARALLNALELAVETTAPNADGTIAIPLAVAEESIQRRAVLYDKEGDAHFDTISAFIKSVRGSDPDAALYWLARMVYAGEDPRFIFRRLVILASEDVGLADPQAIAIVTACANAFDRVGMPEGRYPLAHATLYLATCPKSNTVMGFFEALATVEREHQADVPNHLRDANRDKEGFGHGQGYLYPHAYRDHWVAQQYLPGSLQGQVFYQPSAQGYEATVQTAVARRREAQLAAMVEGGLTASSELVTFSPAEPGAERWLQRALSQAGDRLGQVRDRLFQLAPPQRHHVILDLNARTGLLTWEAVRQVPEGGVYACVPNPQDAAALREQAALLPELRRPVLLTTDLSQLPTVLQQQEPGVRFDRIVGRNALALVSDKAALLTTLPDLLQVGGRILLVEALPREGQHISALLNPESLDPDLYERWQAADAAISQNPDNPLFNWNLSEIEAWLTQGGCTVTITREDATMQVYVSPQVCDRWFQPAPPNAARPSYRDQLAPFFAEAEIDTLQHLCRRQLQNQTVRWHQPLAFILAQV